MFKSALHHGNTKVHKLAKSGCTESEFNTYLAHIGKEKAIQQAKQPNNYGILPIDKLTRGSESPALKRYKSLHSVLFPLTVANTLIPPDRLIDEDELLKKYFGNADAKLKENLQLACNAANEIRKRKIQSYTHPSSNQLTKDEREELRSLVSDMRNSSITKSTNPVFPIKELQKLHEDNMHTISAKVGNCYEFANMAAEELRLRNHAIRIEPIHISNGDHVVAVIDAILTAR